MKGKLEEHGVKIYGESLNLELSCLETLLSLEVKGSSEGIL